MAVDIAERIGAEVMSVDSMQVYRGMDIGTAKPTMVERRGVPHHMIDLVEPEEEFSVAQFRQVGKALLEERDTTLIITGGSGLHFRALVDPMTFPPTDPDLRQELEEGDPAALVAELTRADPGAGDHVDLSNPRRVVRAVEVKRISGQTPSRRAATAEADRLRRYVPEVPFTAVGVDPGSSLGARVGERLQLMRSGGLVEEVSALRHRLGRTARGAIGYREMLSHLSGEIDEAEAFGEAERRTMRLAKRQRTWFQRDPRIRWIPWLEDEEERATRALEALG